jgi:hypothetical protein
MHPTIAEQLAAMRRRELQEAAMMPYDTYRLYETERPKTAAEIRAADERTGRLAATVSGLVRRLMPGGRRPRDRALPAVPVQDQRRQPGPAPDRDRLAEKVGSR